MKSTSFKLNSNQQKDRKKSLLLIGLMVLVLLGAGSALYIRKRNSSMKNTTATTDDAAQTSSAKKDAIEKEDTDEETPDLPKDSTGVTTEQISESVEAKITTVDFNQEGNTLSATANITGARAAGTCVFSFKSPDEKPVVRQVESSTQQCSTSLPKFEFSKNGSWNLSVIRYQDNTKTEATREITIN